MAYEPTNWKTGDVVTSAKLNKLENAVAQSGGTGNLIVHVTEERTNDATIKTLDKTWKDIKDAFVTGNNVYILHEDISDKTTYTRDAVVNVVSGTVNEMIVYGIQVVPHGSSETIELYSTESENGYPQYTDFK